MKEKILDWHQFSYLNGVRRNSYGVLLTYEEYLQNLLDMGVITVNGKVEKKIKKLCVEIAELNTLLMSQVQAERKKDISLYLEDL